MRMLFQCFCVFYLSLLPNAFGQDELGVVGAFQAQTSAWVSGDVLIRIEDFYDSTGNNGIGRFHESVGYHRYRFDHEKKMYFYYGYTEGRTGSVKEAGQKADARRVLLRKAFLVTDGNGFVRDFPNPKRPVQRKSIDEVIEGMKVGYLHLRHIGFCSFGFDKAKCASTTAAAMSSGLALQTAVTGLEDSILVEFTLPARKSDIVNVSELVPTLVWQWNDRGLVPEKLSLYESGVLRGREFKNLRWNEHYTWEEKDGIVIPTRIAQITPSHVKRGDEILAYDKMRFVTMHWFSINQGIPEDTQTIDLNDLQVMEALADPRKQEATGILETL